MGLGSDLRFGIGKKIKTQITLKAEFINSYLINSIVPIKEWLNEPARPINKGIGFKNVQKLNGSLLNLILYFLILLN